MFIIEANSQMINLDIGIIVLRAHTNHTEDPRANANQRSNIWLIYLTNQF